MVADHVFMARKETVGLHFKRLVLELHNERRSEVDEVSISDVWKKCVRKSFGILVIQLIEIGFPEKINELR